jgi:hypothetical protein
VKLKRAPLAYLALLSPDVGKGSSARMRDAVRRDSFTPTPKDVPTIGTAAWCRKLFQRHSMTSSARASSVGGIVIAEGFGGLGVDDEIKFGRLLDRDVGGLRPAQDLVDEFSAAAPHLPPVGPQELVPLHRDYDSLRVCG